jgi:hypothetical protein
MRYQQVANDAYCGDVGSVSKMVTQQENVLSVLGFEVSRSVITVQREFLYTVLTAVSAILETGSVAPM